MLSNNKPHHLNILEFNKDIDEKGYFEYVGSSDGFHYFKLYLYLTFSRHFEDTNRL